jgi:hypothetical protein
MSLTGGIRSPIELDLSLRKYSQLGYWSSKDQYPSLLQVELARDINFQKNQLAFASVFRVLVS